MARLKKKNSEIFIKKKKKKVNDGALWRVSGIFPPAKAAQT